MHRWPGWAVPPRATAMPVCAACRAGRHRSPRRITATRPARVAACQRRAGTTAPAVGAAPDRRIGMTGPSRMPSSQASRRHGQRDRPSGHHKQRNPAQDARSGARPCHWPGTQHDPRIDPGPGLTLRNRCKFCTGFSPPGPTTRALLGRFGRFFRTGSASAAATTASALASVGADRPTAAATLARDSRSSRGSGDFTEPGRLPPDAFCRSFAACCSTGRIRASEDCATGRGLRTVV